MTDLKTALTEALNQWEPPADEASPAPAPKGKRHMTRDCFLVVKDNPGITRSEAIAKLSVMGHKPQSTTSILSQMVRAKMINEDANRKLSTQRKNYTPLGLPHAPAKPKAKPNKAAPHAQASVEEIQRVSAEVDAWLDKASLTAACTMWQRLSYIFGAQK